MKAVWLLLTLVCSLGFAQNTETPKEAPRYYKLDFVIKDLDGGKVVSARNYSTLVSNASGKRSEIRTGNKVPYDTGSGQYQQVDVGTAIDCAEVVELDQELVFQLTADVSSILAESDPHRPIIRQNRWMSHVIVPLRKPTVVFSSDDNTTKHVLQLEVTATPRT